MATVSTAWDGSSGRFTDEQYQSSCVLDRKKCEGDWATKPPKQRCSLPIKEPNGDLNSNGVHAAASRISQVTDACPTAIASAKASLRSAYKTLGETVPDNLKADSSKSEDFSEWGVREGVPRHGEVAVRATTVAEWEVRDAPADGEGSSDSLGTLTGHFAVFNRWTEIDSFFEGRFMERIAPGAFTKTFAENRQGMRVLLNHGRDPSVGMKPLGPITELDQDDTGARYDVNLLDTTYNRDIIPGLKAGQYGASFRFQVIREEVNTKPERSTDNPEAIEERTITEARVREFGPVTFPAYEEATAGIRSLNEELFDLDMGLRSLDPNSAREFLAHLRNGKTRESVNVETDVETERPSLEDAPAAPSPAAPESGKKRLHSTLSSSAARLQSPRPTLRTPGEKPKWMI